METWELEIGLAIIKGMENTMVVMKYIKCFTFNLKELG